MNKMAVLAMAAELAAAGAVRAEGTAPQLTTQYGMRWFSPAPPAAETNFYASGAGLASFAGGFSSNRWTDPVSGDVSGVSFATADGTLEMACFAYGQPVESAIAQYALGDAIPPPDGADATQPPEGFVPVRVGNNPEAYWRNAEGSAIWLPSRGELVAAAGGNLEIRWTGTDDSVVYTVSSIPASRPARIYWTEDPYNAPVVYLSANKQKVYATLHYNNYVGAPVRAVTTNWDATGTNAVLSTNFASGVWMDGEDINQCLRADGVEGIFLLEYYEDGKYAKSLGVQPVQVLAPTIEQVSAGVGDRLLPVDRYYGIEDLVPKATAGIGGGNADKMFLVDGNSSWEGKRNWLYALRATAGTPWDAEVYWQHKDARGVTWPFEVDWYDIDWPLDIPRVAIDPDGGGTPTLLPPGVAGEIASQAAVESPKKEAANASLSSDGTALSFSAPGFALMRYSTTDDFWMEPVQGVRHDDRGEYDPTEVGWPIGLEILPFSDENHVVDFDGEDDCAEATQGTGPTGDRPFTVEAWTYRTRADGTANPVASTYRDADDGAPGAWELGFAESGEAYFETPAGRVACAVPGTALRAWHHLAGERTEGALVLYVDGKPLATNAAPLLAAAGGNETRHLQIARSLRTEAHFGGRIDEVRCWDEARGAGGIAELMRTRLRGARTNLLACYPLDEGRGSTIRDVVDGSYGTLCGSPRWIASFHLADHSHLKDLAAFPGFVFSGDKYNVNRYAYPEAWEESPSSHLFAVNADRFEIWWGRPSRNIAGMPAAVHYPSLVLHYASHWPTDARQIVIASGKGTDNAKLRSPSLYVQNDATRPGYNPNEEHAVLVGDTAYAIRDDLNAPGGASEPFVLLDTQEADGRPSMAVFAVVATNEANDFDYETQAGAAVNPPMPLSAWDGCGNTACVSGPGWKDRKRSWWAKAAGDDGGEAQITMRFYYPNKASFWFPELAAQPAEGAEVPWLPVTHEAGGTAGEPRDVRYRVTWPVNVPEMAVAQTLAEATGGLPDIWNQASVDVIYQQSEANGHGESVVLYDPAREQAADLSKAVVDALAAAGKARKEPTGTRYRFGDTAPALEERLFFDPTRGAEGQLVLSGMLKSPLTGTPYVLPNWLSPAEKESLLALGKPLSGSDASEWEAAVEALPLAAAQAIQPSGNYVNAALSSAPPSDKSAGGYVTLAFNDSTNTARVAEGLPVSLQVIRVSTNLFGSQYLDVVEPGDALEEKLSLVYPDDFGGKADQYEFEWRWSDPVAGMEPGSDKESWKPFFDNGTSSSNGAASITLEGGTSAGTLFLLADHWFAVRYRRADGNGPTGDTWSPWVSSLAPGWIERVMTAINPFDQRYSDMAEYAPGLAQTIVEQCGPPYEGPVALDQGAMDSAGLIQIYQTVMDRALSLSLDAGLADPNCNDSLLFAATRLNKLYMALGNEAYADAMDPTVAIDPDTDGWYGDYAALDTSLFCFENQVPSLLEEELALLRGRDGTHGPSVTVSPVYNRLIWNYTYGIDGGEVAYACNYDIHGVATNTTGDISAEDAKRMYPQGHGDAWGHYLSALAPYYALLAYTNFGWNTIPGATLVGNASVGVDYCDERAFAAAAAAKARTGEDIVALTARRDYAFGAKGLDRRTADADADRAWDVDGWSARAGQGAYFDWAVANSILLDTVTNLSQVGGADAPAEGIGAIDRGTVPEIGTLAAALDGIQKRLDAADAGSNPLGLDENAIPFDLSAARLDEGEGHFEQVYDRALAALRNAKVSFGAAQGASEALRKQYDSAADAVAAAQAEEIAFNNRLIAIYGYPYADDIGAGGTYAQGYDGPDLVHWAILDLDETFGPPPVSGTAVTSVVSVIAVDDASAKDHYGVSTGGVRTNSTIAVTNSFNALGLETKPAGWTGRRRAQGELQAALQDFVEQYYAFLKAQAEYENTLASLRDEYALFLLDADVAYGKIDDDASIADKKKYINDVSSAMDFFAKLSGLVADGTKEVADGAGKAMPGLFASITTWSQTKIGESAASIAASVIWTIAKVSEAVFEYAGETDARVQEKKIINWEQDIAERADLAGIERAAVTLLGDMANQFPRIREMQARLTAMEAAMERVLSLAAEGERTAADRAVARNRIAQRLESARYADMLYRTFRNEALENHSAMLDQAARCAWQAAMAFDYETGLLDAATGESAAAGLLSKIVRARTIGRFASGVPQAAGGEGDGGIADALARLKAGWDVAKPRLGINNPDPEMTRFSLRKELFRISTSSASDGTWRDALAACRVEDLGTVDAYTRFCVPYGADGDAGPGLVIPFSGSIVAGENFFGWPAGGGDNFYDPTWLSTRIRAAGVWFSGYNTAFNTNAASGGGLANTPNVYLVPAGTDTIVSGADRTRTERRTWTVFDQAMPWPADLGTAGNAAEAFAARLAGIPAERRRHPAFRAHHDTGTFSDDELCSNARLVGRSVWNSGWVLIIPGKSLLADPEEGLDRFLYGAKKADGTRDGCGITDIRLYFKTYSYSGD